MHETSTEMPRMAISVDASLCSGKRNGPGEEHVVFKMDVAMREPLEVGERGVERVVRGAGSVG